MLRAAVLICFIPSVAFAGLDYTSDLEATGLGQGGAFVAAPDTLGAIWYNPAGLAGQHGLQLEIEGGIINSPLTYQRAPDAAQASYPLVTNQNPILETIFAGATYDFKIPNLSVGLFAYSPQSNHYEFSPTGPQRFQSVGGKYVLVYFHAVVAYRFFDKLSVGVAAGPAYFSGSQKTILSAAPGGDPESSLWAVPVDIDAETLAIFTANLGVSYTPIPELSIGASFMPPYDVSAPGHAHVTLPPVVASLASVSGDGLTANLKFPAVLRAGVRYRPRPWIAIEVAGVYEGWSRFKQIELIPKVTVNAPALGFNNQALPTLDFTKNYSDLASVRLGVEVKPLRLLTLRAGGFYESSGSKPGYFDISAPDTDKYAVTVGASLHVWRMSIDVAYAHIFVPTVNIANSKLTVDNVITPSLTATVGNGRYNFSYDIFHLGLRFHFFGDGA